MLGADSLGNAIQYAEALVQANPAWDALAAGLRVRELDEEPRDIHHAVVFVHDHHAAGTHDGAQLREVLVVDGRLKHLVGEAAPGGTARLDRFDLASVRSALADVVHERLQWRA